MLCFTSCGCTLTDKNISFNSTSIIQNVLIHDYARYTTNFYTSFAQDTQQTHNEKAVFICILRSVSVITNIQ